MRGLLGSVRGLLCESTVSVRVRTWVVVQGVLLYNTFYGKSLISAINKDVLLSCVNELSCTVVYIYY